jgi:hypothetical protein
MQSKKEGKGCKGDERSEISINNGEICDVDWN